MAAGLTPNAQLYLDKIGSATGRMYTMIDGVLLYSLLNALEAAKEPVDPARTMQNIESDREVLIQQKGATPGYAGLPAINGLPVLLYQLLYNLLNNSSNFAKAGVPPLIEL